MSASGTLGIDGSGKPCGSAPMTSTPRAARSRPADADRARRRPRRGCPVSVATRRRRTRMIARLMAPIAERPEVRLVEALDEGDHLVDEAARVRAEPEQLRQLADEDRDREAGEVPGPDRAREQVGDEPEPHDGRRDRDRPDEQRQHPGERDLLLVVATGERQDRRRDHRPQRGVRPEDQDRRRPDERERDEAHDGRVQAGDGGQPGELGVGHALRDEQRDEHDAGDEVARQPRPLVGAHRRDARHPLLDPAPLHGRGRGSHRHSLAIARPRRRR